MAYVPQYGRIMDNMGGCGHSLCLRGKVTQISFWLNSWLGTALEVDAQFIDGKDLAVKPDLRRIKKADRQRVKQEYEDEVKEKTRVVLDLDTPSNPQFVVRLKWCRSLARAHQDAQ